MTITVQANVKTLDLLKVAVAGTAFISAYRYQAAVRRNLKFNAAYNAGVRSASTEK